MGAGWGRGAERVERGVGGAWRGLALEGGAVGV